MINYGPLHGEFQYLVILRELLEKGDYREGRNGGVYSLFGRQMRFNLKEGFPLLTTKRVHTKSIIVELLWFIRGLTNNNWLKERGVSIWDEWADPETGELGPIYGHQWRKWPDGSPPSYAKGSSKPIYHSFIDQLANVIEGIKNDPYGRRHIVSAWNPADIPDMALPPCHCLFQFHVSNPSKLGERPKLSCHLYQRSADWFLGVPFNIASYALLTHLVARECDLDVGDFVHSFGDLHLYANHVEQAKLQLSREPGRFPKLVLNTYPWRKPIWEIEPEDIQIEGYDPHPAIKAPVSA